MYNIAFIFKHINVEVWVCFTELLIILIKSFFVWDSWSVCHPQINLAPIAIIPCTSLLSMQQGYMNIPEQ